MTEAGFMTKTVQYARSKGYMAKRNYMAPGCEVGWPDVEIFVSSGRVLLIEFKMEGEEPRKIQEHRIGRLRALGHTVITCTSYDDAVQAINMITNK